MLRALVLAGACACLSRAQEGTPSVVRVGTAQELQDALSSTDDKDPAEHILITKHLDLTSLPPGSSVNQPNQAETMFYLTPATKTIRVRPSRPADVLQVVRACAHRRHDPAVGARGCDSVANNITTAACASFASPPLCVRPGPFFFNRRECKLTIGCCTL